MRINLQVPFAEKDHAKRLGARWDAARKVWYVENREDLTPFLKWMPRHLTKATGTAAAATTPAPADARKKRSSTPKKKLLVSPGKVVVGSKFVEYQFHCNCPPWETCEKCLPFVVTDC